MSGETELGKSAFAAHLAQDLAGPAQAILGFQELAVEQARTIGLGHLLPDFERVGGAIEDLNRRLDGLIEEGMDAPPVAGSDAEVRLRHDLRTPLNAIIGYSEMIAEELDPVEHEALHSDIAVILAEAAALLARIDDIVEFSHSAENGGAQLAAEQARSVADGLEASVSEDPHDTELLPGRVLVVDDIDSNRQLLARRLRMDGHEVVLAASGAEALECLSGQAIDLILLDILMPDMNGIELLARIKGRSDVGRVPVIMVSGLTDMEAVIRCIEAGADDYLTKPINTVLLRARMAACLEKKRWADREQRYLQRIELERDRADALLHAILPGQVVTRLNNGEDVIADRFESVTIVFADLVDFTPTAAQTSAIKLVQRLDEIFRAFDTLAEEHGVEKIKTIGDAYMAAAGVPVHSEDHADRAVALGLSMLTTLERVDQHEVPFKIRIGIHTGPIIAGLIGRHRFVYDVWGETVNIASRLEASGLPGRIQFSDATRRALTRSWPITKRGRIDLKGVGSMPAYLMPE